MWTLPENLPDTIMASPNEIDASSLCEVVIEDKPQKLSQGDTMNLSNLNSPTESEVANMMEDLKHRFSTPSKQEANNIAIITPTKRTSEELLPNLYENIQFDLTTVTQEDQPASDVVVKENVTCNCKRRTKAESRKYKNEIDALEAQLKELEENYEEKFDLFSRENEQLKKSLSSREYDLQMEYNRTVMDLKDTQQHYIAELNLIHSKEMENLQKSLDLAKFELISYKNNDECNLNILKKIKIAMQGFDIETAKFKQFKIMEDYMSPELEAATAGPSNPRKRHYSPSLVDSIMDMMKKTKTDGTFIHEIDKTKPGQQVVIQYELSSSDSSAESDNEHYVPLTIEGLSITKVLMDRLTSFAKRSFINYVKEALQHIIDTNDLIYCSATGFLEKERRPAIPYAIRKAIKYIYDQSKNSTPKLMKDFNETINIIISKLCKQQNIKHCVSTQKEQEVKSKLQKITSFFN